MKTMTLEEFHVACKAQAKIHDQIVFKCPMCKTLQSGRDLIAAGAGKDFEAVEHFLAFSCIGRFTGAASPRQTPDGKPCDWTLGGLISLHALEVTTPEGNVHARFELATLEEAEVHRAAIQANGSAKDDRKGQL